MGTVAPGAGGMSVATLVPMPVAGLVARLG